MIDIASESVITLAAAARLRPPSRRDRPTHPSTVARWAMRGLQGAKLETIRIGGQMYTSVEAMQRFAECLTAGASACPEQADVTHKAAAAEREAILRGM